MISDVEAALDTLPPPPRPIQEAAPGPQTGFFDIFPHQPFQFVPTPTQYPAVLALWGPFSPLLSVPTGLSVPEPGSSASEHRRKVEDGT